MNALFAETFFESAEIQHYQIEDATIAVRIFGQGPALVFIHGYPVYGYTWRKLLPELSNNFTCYVIDLPGLGDSDWTNETDFTFTEQARRSSKLTENLGLESYSLIAHDTGATVARLLSLLQPERVKKLVMLNTEIPGHRPPWIQFYQFSAKLPLSRHVFKLLLSMNFILKSSMGLKEFYSDKSLLDDPANLKPYIERLLNSPHRMLGMMAYLKGIEWDVVDAMRDLHKDIQADVLFLWGEDDKTFPVDEGETMLNQFSKEVSFSRIPKASLMPHEEKPEEVLSQLIPFLNR